MSCLKCFCQYDPEIKQRLDELPANAKMMSPDIQNDLLETAASLLLRKMRAELHAQADNLLCHFSQGADSTGDGGDMTPPQIHSDPIRPPLCLYERRHR